MNHHGNCPVWFISIHQPNNMIKGWGKCSQLQCWVHFLLRGESICLAWLVSGFGTDMMGPKTGVFSEFKPNCYEYRCEHIQDATEDLMTQNQIGRETRLTTLSMDCEHNHFFMHLQGNGRFQISMHRTLLKRMFSFLQKGKWNISQQMWHWITCLLLQYNKSYKSTTTTELSICITMKLCVFNWDYN